MRPVRDTSTARGGILGLPGKDFLINVTVVVEGYIAQQCRARCQTLTVLRAVAHGMVLDEVYKEPRARCLWP